MDSLSRPHPQPTPCALPLVEVRVPAGFPSPAADYVQRRIDLNEQLVHDVPATFFIRAAGDSMRDAGILDGSILVVNSARTAASGDVVVARIDGQYTVKRLRRHGDRYTLHPDNAHVAYPVLEAGEELHIFGVVTAIITELIRPGRGRG